MSVKGIVVLNANADRHYSQHALHSLDNFNANLSTKDFDTLEREQKNLSEELRERFKRAAEEDANEINYELWKKIAGDGKQCVEDTKCKAVEDKGVGEIVVTGGVQDVRQSKKSRQPKQ